MNVISHATLVDRWRSRLAEAERQITCAPSHRRWLPGVYARVYRFLLSCYGDELRRDDAPADSSTDRMGFHDTTQGNGGAVPKSSESIRATLSAIHQACGEVVEPGPMTGGGLRNDDWIAVAAESAWVSPTLCVRLLHEHGLRANQVRRGDDTIVVVPAGQRDRAFSLLRDNRDRLRKPWRRGRRAQVVCLTFLAVLVCSIPTVLGCTFVFRWICGQWTGFPSLADRSILVATIAFIVAWIGGLLLSFSLWPRRR